MQSEELLKLTASEPLSLDDEYKMQESWRQDTDKLTFLILDKSKFTTTKDEIESLVGDTNIFIKDEDDKFGEIEIMIAEETARRKGFGRESTLLMLRYAIENLKLKKLQAIIGSDNSKSIKMFQNLQFVQKCGPNIFNEVLLEATVEKEWVSFIENETKSYSIEPYS
jgi:RimJ/RimL family protein N-acetyltransferase